MDEKRFANWADYAWLLIVGLASTVYCAAEANRIGPTFDEPLYIRCGLERWRTGSTYELMRVGTMPLPVDVAVLPVAIWERCRGVPFDAEADLSRILPIARLGTLAFWWLLLIYGWLIAWRIGGAWAARLAVIVLAVEPNLLAHAGLATTDLALTATLLAFCYHYWRGREGAWRSRVGIPAIFCAAAVLAKASALVFVPICMVAIEFERVWSKSNATRAMPRIAESIHGLFARRNRVDAIVMFLIAQALVFIYCGSDWLPHDRMVAAAHALPDSPWRGPAIWTAEHFRIFNNAGVALSRQIMHNAQGHRAYLLGDTARRAFWYYFPVALSIKMTLPILLLIAAVAMVRVRAMFNWPLLAAAALLVFSFTCRVQIGVRFFLPLIALTCIGASISVAEICRSATPFRRRWLAVAAIVLVGWSAVECATIFPDALCFTNGLWGPRDRGYQLLSDSNYDWGQGIPELTNWMRSRRVSEIEIWYFGADPAAQRAPFRPITALEIRSAELQSHPKCRYLAVGATILYGSYVVPDETPLIERLRRQRPVDRTETFLIFELEDVAAAADGHSE